MKKYDYREKWKELLTPEIISLLTTIHEYKWKQRLIAKRYTGVLSDLENTARIRSTKSSNMIDGIYTSDERLKKIVLDKTVPRNRNEQEIAGYRDVLNTIHRDYDYIPIRSTLILQLHRDLNKFRGPEPADSSEMQIIQSMILMKTEMTDSDSIRFLHWRRRKQLSSSALLMTRS